MPDKEIRIVDAYCGVGPWATRDRILPYTAGDIQGIMDACGIDSALVFSNTVYYSGWSVDANRLAVEAAKECRRFRPSFILAPRPYDDSPKPEDYAREMKKAGARTAWLMPGQQQHGVQTWVLQDLLDMCVQHRLPLFLAADSVSPDQIDVIGREFPKLRLVLANLGYRSDGWLYPLLRRHPAMRICLGTTYIPPRGPEQFVRHFGAERMIFGSGLPFVAPGGMVAFVMYSRLSDADKRRVLSGNIEALMKEVRL